MKRPESKEEVLRFLGLVAYMAKFLDRQSQLSAPLRALLRDEVDWTWSPVQEEALVKLKALVTAAPVFAFYSPRARTVVSADASSFGIGAVLLQVQEDGRKAPVMYISRALTPTEQNYAQIEKEALAMTWACEKFHCYLFGSEEPFLIETDHKPLVTIIEHGKMPTKANAYEATFVPLLLQGCLCAGQEVGDRRYAFQSTSAWSLQKQLLRISWRSTWL